MPGGTGQARYVLLGAGLIGECLFGGVIFGWNALRLVLEDMQFFEEGCGLVPTTVNADSPRSSAPCKSQDSKLAVVFIVGILAVNFGPAVAGPGLDFFGPRVVAAAGSLVPCAGFIMMGTPQPGHDIQCRRLKYNMGTLSPARQLLVWCGVAVTVLNASCIRMHPIAKAYLIASQEPSGGCMQDLTL